MGGNYNKKTFAPAPAENAPYPSHTDYITMSLSLGQRTPGFASLKEFRQDYLRCGDTGNGEAEEELRIPELNHFLAVCLSSGSPPNEVRGCNSQVFFLT